MTGPVHHLFTDRRHGDLAVGHEIGVLDARRGAIAPVPWTWLRQVHGAEVMTVTAPGEGAGRAADAAVTTTAGAVLVVQTADCAPVLFSGNGGLGVAHAGWRGIVDGVLEATVAALIDLGATPDRAVLGPCIRAGCYEFGPTDLDVVADRYGPAVRAETSGGAPALDVAAAVRVALDRQGIELDDHGVCTACSSQHWSHRARQDAERQALVAWLEP